MKKLSLLSLLLLSSCAGPCVSYPWTLYLLYPLAVFDPHTYRGHDGSSISNAVILDGPKGEKATAEAESAYLVKKFKVGPQTPIQLRLEDFGVGQKKYHNITIKTPDGKERVVYFDITSTL